MHKHKHHSPLTQWIRKEPYDRAELREWLASAPLLVAVSGGADSMALFHCLVAFRAEECGLDRPFGLTVGHVEHGLRGAESLADAAFVKAAAEKQGVPFLSESVDVAAACAATGESVEMAARRLRREALVRMTVRCGAKAIALAHTMDDQAELFFLRIGRGSSLRGIAGMTLLSDANTPEAPGLKLLRPFLHERHADLCELMRDWGEAWREDATNAGDDALRNRVRHHLMPTFEAIFGPSAVPVLTRMQTVFAAEADVLEAEADARLAQTDALEALRAEAIAQVPPALARTVVVRWLRTRQCPPPLLSFRVVESVRRLLSEGGNGVIELGGGYAVRIAHGLARLQVGGDGCAVPKACAPSPAPFVLHEGLLDPANGLSAAPTDTVVRPPRVPPQTRPLVCTISATALADVPVRLRPVQRADRIRPVGGKGHYAVWDLLADFGIPAEERSRIAVLARVESHDVLWLPGYGVAEAVAARTPGEPLWLLTLS